MIKLFFVALLCVAVFADSPADEMNQMWMEPARAMADMAQHAMGQGSSLVRRAAQMTAQGPPQRPPEGPSPGPQGQNSEMN